MTKVRPLIVRRSSIAVRSSVSPFLRRATSVGLTTGSFIGSTPAPGRNDATGGVSPISPGTIGMPLGMGIGIAMAPPLIPAMPGIAVVGAGDAAGGVFDESGPMPGIPDMPGGIAGGADGGCCPSAIWNGVPRTAATNARRTMRVNRQFRGTPAWSRTSAVGRLGISHAARSAPRASPKSNQTPRSRRGGTC